MEAVNLTDAEMDDVVWRYLTFPKFVSLITFRALWFSKLSALTDQLEGEMPHKVDREMLDEYRSWNNSKAAGFGPQIEELNRRNVADGRELTLVNCWFGNATESADMWREYAGRDGVAVVSTIGRLRRHVQCNPEFSQVGRVRYIDHAIHEMSQYHATQAGQRAFLKDARGFSHEKEVRMTTFNVKGPMCVNFDGSEMARDSYAGAGMNNFDKPGLYIKADLQRLITKVVIPSHSETWFEATVSRLLHLSRLTLTVERSSLSF